MGPGQCLCPSLLISLDALQSRQWLHHKEVTRKSTSLLLSVVLLPSGNKAQGCRWGPGQQTLELNSIQFPLLGDISKHHGAAAFACVASGKKHRWSALHWRTPALVAINESLVQDCEKHPRAMVWVGLQIRCKP